MKSRKIKIFSLILILIILAMSLTAIVFAYNTDDDTGGTGGTSSGKAQSVDGACLNWPSSGIVYEITVENPDGTEKSFTKKLYCDYNNDDNKQKWYGAIKGYGVTGKTDLDKPCPLPKDQIEIPIEDVIGFLELHGQTEMVQYINNAKADTTVTLVARSFLKIGNTIVGGESDVFWTDAIKSFKYADASREGSYSWNLYNPLIRMKDAIYEENEDMWAFLAKKIGCGVYGFSNYYGWFATKYTELGPPAEPMDMRLNVEPVVYANIDNTQFSVYSASDVNGNPIPTSEKVNIAGKSNMYGSVEGLKKYGVQETVSVSGTIKADYYTYDSINKMLIPAQASKTYSGSTTGWVTWLDASEATLNKKAELEFGNLALKDGKVTDSKSATNARINPNSKKGSYTLKAEPVDYTYTVPASEVTALTELLELANAGSSWANAELINRTNTMKIEAEERVKELTPFYDVETDTVTFNGENVERNGALIGNFYAIDKKDNVIQNVANLSAAGNSYITTGTAKGGDLAYTIKSTHHNKVNNIRVHTPINCDILINGVRASEYTILPKTKIEFSMPLDATSVYYSALENFGVAKYVDSIKIVLIAIDENGNEIIKKDFNVTSKSKIKPYTQMAKYTVPDIPENTSFKVDVEVYAINSKATGANTNAEAASFNTPDNVYVLKTSGKGAPIAKPEGGYTLEFQKDKECNKTVDANAKIKNDRFKPESGYLIPTSESLYVDGSTNLAGQLTGVKVYEMRFTSDYKEYVYIKGSYIDYYQVSEQKEKLVNGVWTLDGSPVTKTYFSRSELDANLHSTTVTATDGLTRTTYGYPLPHYSENGTWVELNQANCPGFDYTVTTEAQVSNVVNAYITNTPLGGTRSKVLATPELTITTKGTLDGKDAARVTHNSEHYIGSYDTEEALDYALSTYTINQSHFWSIASDTLTVEAKKGGVTSTAEYSNNCPVLTTDFSGIERTPISGIDKPAIDLIANGNYISSGKLESAGAEYPIPNINPVYVYTPVSNQITVTVSGDHSDEYAGRVEAEPGEVLAQLGDTLTVTLNLGGTIRSGYAPGANPNPVKYTTKLEFVCEVCGHTEVVNNPGSTASHTCTVLVNLEEKDYVIASIVTAENVQSSPDTANGTYNYHDNEYLVRNSTNLSVIGDIYDFNVRTTNDTGWKMKAAEFLSKLPAGEKGDNANSIYRYGIKLGYRAYFDLKTLGSKSNKIKLTPKFYYVSKDGSTIIEDPNLYYRTAKGYKKLADSDIAINMTMTSTNGDVNNPSFKREQALSLQSPCFKGIDYDMRTGIGGLNEVTLTQNNAVTTKYKSQEFQGADANVSRRWLGEIYLPASTVVAQDGATLTQIANKQKVYLDGYLLVTFEDVYSVESDGTRYLNYDSMKIDREQSGKSSLTLPDALGATKTMAIPEDELPVVIYDISLRANNDYESEGTH